jgi:hypothetical protein
VNVSQGSSSRDASAMNSQKLEQVLPHSGYPIRKSTGQSVFAASYSLSLSASTALTEIYRETSDLPIGQQKAVLRDCILDILMVDSRWETVVTLEDASRLIRTIISENLVIKPRLEEDSFVRDLVSFTDLIISSQSISDTERLVNALKKSESSQNSPDQPNMVVSGNTIIVRIPSYDKSNTGQTDALGKYLRWAVTLLGIKDPEVKILPDSKLGNAIQLPAKIERMMDQTISAISLPPNETGDRAEFKTGLKANLVELLACIRLMRRYQGSVRKAPAPQGKRSLQTTIDDLRKSVNGRSGLNEHGLSAFSAIFIKNVFNELTKPNFAKFPGKWIASLKNTNNVKNNIGIIYKLGYEASVINPQKLLSVIRKGVTKSTVEETISPTDKRSKDRMKSKEEKYELQARTKEKLPEGITHPEFRLGVMLLLPLIDPKAKESPKDQLSRDPLTVKDKTITSFYNKNKDIVDATNLAYATLSALGKKGSNASTLGYRSARGHSIRMSANREWYDATGTKYAKFVDVPEHIRNFLLALLNRKLAKGDSSEEGPHEEDDESLSTERESIKRE